MKIFPAIDIYEGKAVRLFKGEYDKMTVYGDPLDIAADFVKKGAECIHIVDLEGAKNGTTPNLNKVLDIKKKSRLFCEIGGGIRSMDVVDRYIEGGMDSVILGTSAVKDEEFLRAAVKKYGEKITVGADCKNGFVAVKGWTETSGISCEDFFKKMLDIGVKRIVCTDVSKDGAMQGTNRELYKRLNGAFDVDIVASGGVSSMDDVVALKNIGMYGAIIGKAYYTGDVDLAKAIEVAK